MNQFSANWKGASFEICLDMPIWRQEDRTSPGSPIAAPNSPEEKLEKLVREAVKNWRTNTPASAVVSCKVTLLNQFLAVFFQKGKICMRMGWNGHWIFCEWILSPIEPPELMVPGRWPWPLSCHWTAGSLGGETDFRFPNGFNSQSLKSFMWVFPWLLVAFGRGLYT